MTIIDEKPKPMRLTQITDLYFSYYWAKEMDEWIDKLIMNYEDRLLAMKNKIEELLDDVGTEHGFEKLTAGPQDADYNWPVHSDYDIYIRRKS